MTEAELRAKNERLLAAIRGALDAIDRYPEHKHPMTASEVEFRTIIAR